MTEKTKKFKWTPEMESFVTEAYTGYDESDKSTDYLKSDTGLRAMVAEKFGFAVADVKYRSLVSKLANLGVYEKIERVTKPRDDGPTKKEILAAIAMARPLDKDEADGLLHANKAALYLVAELVDADLSA